MRLCKKCIDRLGIEYEESNECMLCSKILWNIEEVAGKIIERLKDYEFDTFLIGCRITGSLKALEDYIFEEYGLREDCSIKYEFNREVGIAIAKAMKKEYASSPDITIIYNLEDGSFEIQVKPLYIFGRYRKRVRTIPQTRWYCIECRGKGCEKCNYTGKMYATSVEELIAEPFVEIAEGSKAVLHGSGREDIDARMLGSGRPFVLEIQNPKKRGLNLRELEEIVNSQAGGKIVVSDLRFADLNDIEKIKKASFNKTYRAKIEFEGEVEEERLVNALRSISNTVIMQKTPERVKHRRADILRKRRTFDVRLLLCRNRIAVVEIDAESGLYIKELISGDNGRTSPSLSEVLNNYARVSKLDVIKVWDNI
jgi:tRNA pseudouridine synthase 10